MSSKFLDDGSGDTDLSVLTDGTFSVNAESLTAQNLIPSFALKTNADRKIVSAKLDSGDLNSQTTIDFTEAASPGNPASGDIRIYAKTDKLIYAKDDAGTETLLGGGSLIKVSANDTTAGYLEDKVNSSGVDGVGLIRAIENEGANENIQFRLGDHYLGLASTSLYTGAVLSAGTIGTFNLTTGEGFHIDSNTNFTDTKNNVSGVSISVRNNEPLTNIATHPVTYIMVNELDVIQQLTAFPTPEQRRDFIFIGVVVHSDNTTVNAVNNLQVTGNDITAQLCDVMEGLGFFNLSDNVITANGANLSLNKSAGKAFKRGGNYTVNKKDPHTITLAGLVALTFRYRNQDSSEGGDLTLIDPTDWDNAGTTTPIPQANDATIQRVYIFPSNTIRIMRGQEVFGSLAEAIEAVGKETHIDEPNIKENGLLLASIAMRRDTTFLNDTNQAQIFIASRFGEFGGSGGSSGTTTLNQAYLNSIDPEIVTSNGALTLLNGDVDDEQHVLEISNLATNVTFSVNGSGDTLINHTSTTNDDHTLELDHNADGFNDSKALDIVYTTGASTGEEEAILINVDKSGSAGGNVDGIVVLATEGTATATALLVGVGISPILHEVGSFADPSTGTIDINAVSVAVGALSGTSLFENDNEYVIINDVAKYEEIEFLLGTTASQTIQPTFEFSSGVGTWTTFSPIDGTNGMRNSGIVAFTNADVIGWVSDSGYKIRITRTRNNVTTDAIAINNGIKVAVVNEYGWDLNADVLCNSIDAVTYKESSVSGTIARTIGSGASMVISNEPLAGGLMESGGNNNILYGQCTGESITIADNNTCIGNDSGAKIVNNNNSTFVGQGSGKFMTGGGNTAVGQSCLIGVDGDSGGQFNVAIGQSALSSLTTADDCVAVGQSSLFGVTTGNRNVGIGRYSGRYITTGLYNTCLGYNSGQNDGFGISNYNIAIGHSARNTDGTSNQMMIGGTGANAISEIVAGVTNTTDLGSTTLEFKDAHLAGEVYAGNLTTTGTEVHIGLDAGLTTQGTNSVAIGLNAGKNDQKASAVAIGDNAGLTTQSLSAVSIGAFSGVTTQGLSAVCIGNLAGNYNQGAYCVGLGYNAGNIEQGADSVSIGKNSGKGALALNDDPDYGLPPDSVAIGVDAFLGTQELAGDVDGSAAVRITPGFWVGNGTNIIRDPSVNTGFDATHSLGYCSTNGEIVKSTITPVTSFAPTFIAIGANFTQSLNTSSYTIQGKLVTFNFSLSFSKTSSSSGDVAILLPFISLYDAPVTISRVSQITYADRLTGMIEAGQQAITLYSETKGGTNTEVIATDVTLTTTGTISGSVQYFIA